VPNKIIIEFNSLSSSTVYKQAIPKKRTAKKNNETNNSIIRDVLCEYFRFTRLFRKKAVHVVDILQLAASSMSRAL
jgi:hypothetical protein